MSGFGSGSGLASFIPLIFMFAIFYLLLIRPQQKKAKEHKAVLESLQKGDQVVTAGGIHGRITAVDDAVVTLEIATGVNIKMNKGFIASVSKKD
jgi:preprotein translocase subunit YajC